MAKVICAGLGPGDPDLVSLRAARTIGAARQVAYFRKAGRPGQARRIAAELLHPEAVELAMEYPVTTELPVDGEEYNDALAAFYDDWAERLVALPGEVVVLCEGDPFFYGSFMHLYVRLRGRVELEVIPGIPGMAGCWHATGEPITWGDDVMTVLPGHDARGRARRTHACRRRTGGDEDRPQPAQGAARAGRRRPAGRRLAGRTRHDARRACAAPGRRRPRGLPVLRDRAGARPRAAAGGAGMTGWVTVAGLGPGAETLVTPEVSAALAEATDIVGYIPYVARVAARPELRLHASDNRVEVERARHALELAAAGARVVIVSSGDPGVFAMAAALFEALEAAPQHQQLDIRVLPGITAMLAAAARAGAPLGHDFCAINLSDNLKPWALIEARLRAAAQADFAMAFYNPRSRSRPEGFARVLELLRDACGGERLITFARAVSTPEEQLVTVTLAEATPEMADMRTVVLVGNSATRRVGRWVYTPRSA